MSHFCATHPLTGEALTLPSEPLPLPHPSFAATPCEDPLDELISEVCARSKPVVVGVVGAAASGKTTLCGRLQRALAASGERAVHLHGDDFTRPPAQRYELIDGVRRDRVFGPDIYDHDALLRAIEGARSASDVVLVDSVLLGWHAPTAKAIGLLVGLHVDEATRLRRKLLRDHSNPRRAHGLVDDFVRKQLTEVRPMHGVFLDRSALVWDASTAQMYRRHTAVTQG